MTLARHGIRTLVAFLAAGLGGGAVAADFIYEGTLDEHGRPADGRYDLRLTLATSASDPLPLSTIDFPATEVVNGRFRLAFDLPGLAVAEPWVGLAVRAAGDSAFTTISGRSKAIAGAGQCWGLTGDAGTDASINFLGTTDAEPLVLRAGSARAMRIEPSEVLFQGLPLTANMLGGARINGVVAGVRGATIAGGGAASTDPDVPGANLNAVLDSYGAVGGGANNIVGQADDDPHNQAFATIAGGNGNVAPAEGASIGGGIDNAASGELSTIAGGTGNEARGLRSSVAGGGFNEASGTGSVVAGGTTNAARGGESAVLGGNSGTAGGTGAVVLGGNANSASGRFATTPNGQLNCAGGDFSWAGGRRAVVRPGTGDILGIGCGPFAGPVGSGDANGDEGVFAWADAQDAQFTSTGPNQFLVRADGGVGINNAAIPTGTELLLTNRTTPNPNVDIFLRSTTNTRGINLAMLPGSGSNPAEFRIAQYDGASFTDRLFLAANGNLEVTANAFKPGGGSWAVSSDARLKHHVAPLSGTLDRLLALQGVHFEYLDPDPAKRPAGTQVGFVAQDVQQVFPDWVSTDGDGYLMVAPRGFEALTVEALRELRAESATIDASQEDRLAALETRNAALEARNAELAVALDTLRAEVAALRSRGGQAP